MDLIEFAARYELAEHPAGSRTVEALVPGDAPSAAVEDLLERLQRAAQAYTWQARADHEVHEPSGTPPSWPCRPDHHARLARAPTLTYATGHGYRHA